MDSHGEVFKRDVVGVHDTCRVLVQRLMRHWVNLMLGVIGQATMQGVDATVRQSEVSNSLYPSRLTVDDDRKCRWLVRLESFSNSMNVDRAKEDRKGRMGVDDSDLSLARHRPFMSEHIRSGVLQFSPVTSMIILQWQKYFCCKPPILLSGIRFRDDKGAGLQFAGRVV